MVMRQPGHLLFSALLCLSPLDLHETGLGKVSVNEEPSVTRLEVSKFEDSKEELDICVQCVRIAFVDDDLLALTFVKPGNLPKTQMGKSVNRSGPILFRTIFLDVKTGQPKATHDWSSATTSFEFLPTHDGRFLLATPEEIRLYSGSFELLGRRELPPKGPGSTFSHAIVSWSGHRIVVKSFSEGQTKLEMLDADSLQVLHSWITPESVISFTGADNAVTVETRSEIQFAKAGASWRSVHAFPDFRSCTNRSVLGFISDDKFVFRDCDNAIAGMDIYGKLLFKAEPFAPHTELYSVATSQDGEVFGALVYRTFCASSWFGCLFDPIAGSTPERVVIYDALGGRPIYEKRIAGDRKHPLGQIALSPHGSLFAVLFGVLPGRVNGIVEIIRLPALETHQSR
jgi:hypothetical protein